MKCFTDEEVLQNEAKYRSYCRDLPRVSHGVSKGSRNNGDNANCHNNWIMWRREARERRLV